MLVALYQYGSYYTEVVRFVINFLDIYEDENVKQARDSQNNTMQCNNATSRVKLHSNPVAINIYQLLYCCFKKLVSH